MDSFLSIKENSRYEKIIERSQFITHLFYVTTQEEAKQHIVDISKQFADATHNCYAFIVEYGRYAKSSDDGEPSGTAGVPMLEALKNNNLVNVLAIVTRYFGGVKLGKGGLLRAYSGLVSEAVKKTGTKQYFAQFICTLTLKYDEFYRFTKEFSSADIKVINNDFDEDVVLTFAVKKAGYKPFIDKFKAIFYDKEPKVIKEEFF